MPASVVTGNPADEPDVYVLVAVDRGVMPAALGVAHLIAPQVRAACQVLGEFSQFALVEIPGGERREGHCRHSSLLDGRIRRATAGSHREAAALGSPRGSHGGL